jgi:hypothetical protein
MNSRKVAALKRKIDKEMESFKAVLIKKYQSEYIQLVQKELKDGEQICSGMGSTELYDKDGEPKSQTKLLEVVSEMEWSENAVLCLPYKMSNRAIITDKDERILDGMYNSVMNGMRRDTSNPNAMKEFGLVARVVAHDRILLGEPITADVIKLRD